MAKGLEERNEEYHTGPIPEYTPLPPSPLLVIFFFPVALLLTLPPPLESPTLVTALPAATSTAPTRVLAAPATALSTASTAEVVASVTASVVAAVAAVVEATAAADTAPPALETEGLLESRMVALILFTSTTVASAMPSTCVVGVSLDDFFFCIFCSFCGGAGPWAHPQLGRLSFVARL